MPTKLSATLRAFLATAAVSSGAAAQTAADADTALSPVRAGGATADARVAADPVELAQMLGDASWAVRDEAERTLISYPMPCVGRIETVLAGPISAEHRQRLLNVCRRRFLMEPRAALGVRFAPGADERGVVIDTALPTFDAANLIESGDVVLSMDDMSIRDQDDLRAAIISHDPGDRVSLRLLRGGEPVVGTVRLGAFADLQERFGLNSEVVSRAWDWRLARLGVEAGEAEPVESGLAPAAWQAAAREASTASGNAAMARRGAPDDVVGVTVGGEARPEVGALSGVPASQAAARIVIFNGDRAGDRRNARLAQIALLQRSLSAVQGEITNVRARMEPLERDLSRGDLPEQERARIAEQVRACQNEVAVLRVRERNLISQIELLNR